MASSETVVIRGELNWAKVLGAPRLNTYSGEKEWSVDVTPDAAGRKLLQKHGISSKLREPKENDERTESFLSFRQREFRTDKDGNRVANDPIKIVDVRNRAWDGQKLIGNGSIGDVKFTVKDYGPGKQKGAYIQAIRVLEHVPYESQEFAPLSSDDEYFAGEDTPEVEETADEVEEPNAKGDSPEADEIDDDIPF